MSVEDVAQFSMIVLRKAQARNQIIDVGGPENLTLNQVADLFEKARGRPAKKRHAPLLMLRIMRLLIRPFNPVLSLQIMGGILMDTENQACDMSATLELYPLKLKRLSEIAQQMAETPAVG